MCDCNCIVCDLIKCRCDVLFSLWCLRQEAEESDGVEPNLRVTVIQEVFGTLDNAGTENGILAISDDRYAVENRYLNVLLYKVWFLV